MNLVFGASGKKPAKTIFTPSPRYGLMKNVQIQGGPSVEVATRFGISPSLYSEVSAQKIIAREMKIPKANAWALKVKSPADLRDSSYPAKVQVVDFTKPVPGGMNTRARQLMPPAAADGSQDLSD